MSDNRGGHGGLIHAVHRNNYDVVFAESPAILVSQVMKQLIKPLNLH